MSDIVIKYNGVNITDDVMLLDAEFISRTDAQVGQADFRVLDRKDGFYSKEYFQVGNEVTLDVDGVRIWGGYIEQVTYDYPGAVWWVNPTTPRYIAIRCVDYNILFHRRILWNKADPEVQMKLYAASGGTDSDKKIIRDMCNLYLDLSGDGFAAGAGSDAIDLSNVEELGDIFWLENCSTTWQAASPGNKWGDGMGAVAQWSGAVFYIGAANPSQTHLGPTLYYHDVNSVTGPYELNDRPASSPGSAGVQDFSHEENISSMATEALVWGAGMGSTEIVFHRETAATQQSIYGTWQWGDFVQTMWLLECIKHRAKTHVHGSRQNKRGHKKPKETWRATIFTPDFFPGDVVDMHSYVFDIQDNVPIREMKITFINPTQAKFELILSHEMDTAYITSMWWDPDDPTEPKGEPKEPGDPIGDTNLWKYQTIPLGIGPIITPQPSEPPDTNYTCVAGPPAALIDKVRFGSSGSVESLGVDFRPFDGNTHFGSYLNRTGSSGWPYCPCGNLGIIGLGCWHGESFKLQYWYKIDIPVGFDNTLYVLGEKIAYEGTPGDFQASLASESEYSNRIGAIQDAGAMRPPGAVASGGSIGGVSTHAANGWGGFVDTEVTGEEDYKTGGNNTCDDVMDGRLPPTVAGSRPFCHWYSGCWGGWSYIPTFALSNPTAGESVYLVFTPGWDVEPVDLSHAYCDSAYCAGGVAKGQGPAAEGLGGSGDYRLPITLDTIVCSGGVDSYTPFPTDNNSVGYYQGPTDKTYYTQFPYVPGTLSVWFNGVPYHNFVEMDPATGMFSVHVGGMYSYGSFDISYLASSPDPVDHESMGDYNDGTGTDNTGTDVGGPVDGAVYRPAFKPAFGWQTVYDGANVPFAAIATFIDRTTQGRTQVTPPAVRSYSNITHHGQIVMNDVVNTLKKYEVGYWWPGTISWEGFISGLNEGRGAVIYGDPQRLGAFSPYTGTGPFTGPHMLYVNEVKANGWLVVYDSFWRTAETGVRSMPPSVIRDYAASGAQDLDGRVNVVFTYKTQRVIQ